MHEREKLKILSDTLGSYIKSGTELLFRCPECQHHKNKMSINIEKGFFKCWICDYSGRSIRRLLRKHGDFKTLSKWKKLTNKVDINEFAEDIFDPKQKKKPDYVEIPEEFISLLQETLPSSAHQAVKYLENRGITKKDIVRWKMGYCISGKYNNRIVIPSFDLTGRCNYFVARSYIGNSRKYLNPPASRDIVFNELYVDWDKDIILVEGLFDAFTAGTNAIPLLGSSMHESSALLRKLVDNDAKIYIALDSDAESKSMNIIKKMFGYGLEIYKVDIGPYSDLGEMSQEEFDERKEKAELINSDSYLTKMAMAI
jgi:DNA primase